MKISAAFFWYVWQIVVSIFVVNNVPVLVAQCPNNLISNGSFVSRTGEAVTAAGWSGSSTPDINCDWEPLKTTPSYKWTGKPLPSADGGTWQNLFGTESIEQEINVKPGVPCALQFEYAAHGITSPSFNFSGPVGINVYINDVLTFAAPDDQTQYTWEQTSFTFTPVTAKIKLRFSATKAQYVGIDGICCVPYLNLGNDTTLCAGASLLLRASGQNASYLWQDSSTESTLFVNKPGKYWVRMSLYNQVASDTITVSYIRFPKVNLGKDTTLCDGEKLILDALAPGFTYCWQDNAYDPFYEVTKPGKYWVKLTKYKCHISDTIQIKYRPFPDVNLGPDILMCEGENVLLKTDANYTNYLWQNYAKESYQNVRESGKYWVRVANGRCTKSDTVHIEFKAYPVVDLGPDTALCPGNHIILGKACPDVRYLWQNGTREPQMVVRGPGLYWVEMARDRCAVRDTIRIDFFPENRPNLGEDLLLCEDEKYLLQSQVESIPHLWQNGSGRRDFLVSAPGLYWVQTADKCGVHRDTVYVKYEKCSCQFFIPNAFTPNKDNLNDGFSPVFDCRVVEVEFSIYNRWGQRIYESRELNPHWNGMFAGEPVPAGMYSYVFQYKFPKGASRREAGSILVLR